MRECFPGISIYSIRKPSDVQDREQMNMGGYIEGVERYKGNKLFCQDLTKKTITSR